MPARPVRVLSVIYPFRPTFSGEGEWWLRVIPFLRDRGVDVEILARGESQNGGPEYVEGVVVHRIPSLGGQPSLQGYARGLLATMLALRRRQQHFDVVLFHGPSNDAVYAGCLAGRLGGWKTIYKATLLGCDDLTSVATSGRLGCLRLAALGLAHGFISLSRVLVRPYERRAWLRNRLLVVPQGVDLDRFSPADPARKREIRRRLGLPDTARVALFCGGVIHRKGVDLLVDAWREVSRRVPEAVLLIVGPNHEGGLTEAEDRRFSEAIACRIRELGMAERARLLGYQRQMDQYYAAADVFVFPSRREGWGAAITEAMASGLPCVVSFLHGIAEEHLQDGVEGFIVRSEAPEDYAQRLVTLLTHDGEARQIGARARKRVEERFAIGRIADQYAEFFRRILQEESPRYVPATRPA